MPPREFVIGDTHFRCRNLVTTQCRPEDNDERIIANWQRLVEPEDVVYHLGDLAYGTNASVKGVVPELPGQKVLVLGNHDGETGGRTTAAIRMRTRYFPNPFPDGFYTGCQEQIRGMGPTQNTYAWEWGDALFVVLDPFRYTAAERGRRKADNWGRTLGKAQYDWLKTTLEQSKARFRFVFIHHLVGGLDRNARGGAEAALLYEWGGHDPDGADTFQRHRPGWPMPIHWLLVENRVNVVFHGHDHFFAHQELDGITYQLVPQPGHAGFKPPRYATEYGYRTGDILGGSGHLRVQVGKNQVRIDYILSRPASNRSAAKNGDIAFSYQVKPSVAAR